jgi:mannosyltransferase OCH1-like enzyme
LPEIYTICRESWALHCPNYEIKFWNENNVDILNDDYLFGTFDEKDYSAMSDYFRLKIVYELGGIYLDIDVELLKPLDSLLKHKAFFSLENDGYINTGSGFGAEVHNPLVKTMMEAYVYKKPWKHITCPVIDTSTFTKNGYKSSDDVHDFLDATIYPTEYFSPFHWSTKNGAITSNTYAIHHYSATWVKPIPKLTKLKVRIRKFLDLLHLYKN